MSNIKWMPLAGLDLSAANIAAAEKLRKFGFAVDCSEFGTGKFTKAGLCVYDVLTQQENPNILIVTRPGELYSWYKVLVTAIGADFKIVTGAPNALLFMNEFGAGLYIISKDALFGENILKKKIGKDFLWNLIIIDEEQSLNVPDYAKYESSIIWKSERLLIEAPVPSKGPQDKIALTSLVKSVLSNDELSEKIDDVEFKAGCARLNIDSPVMRYFDINVYKSASPRNVVIEKYGFEDEVMQNLRRRVELRSGLPSYRYGGNVFEDYDCEKFDNERRIYVKRVYSASDVADLRKFDKKLDCLFKVCDRVLADSGRVMIYCCDKNTSEYLHKALTAVYKDEIHAARGGLFREEDVTGVLSATTDKKNQPKILVGMDDLGTVGEGYDGITCVINYELPMSPLLLERRMTRHSVSGKAEFVIFRDTNNLFDSVILDKTLFIQADRAFCGDLPTRNILFDIKERGHCLNNLISDLKYIRSIARQEENCLDLIKRVKGEYALPQAEKISSAKQLAEFADISLSGIYDLFGLSDNSSETEISETINALNGLCVMNNGKLENVSDREGMGASFESGTYTNEPFAAEAVLGLSDAKAQIDELHKDDNFHLRIKEEISKLHDCIQYPVLYGIWKYRAKEQDSDRSFKDYIKIYNDGL